MDDELDHAVLDRIDPSDPKTFPGGRYPTPTMDEPTDDELIDMERDVADVLATDGCIVEPDGYCPHGHPSWLWVKAEKLWGAV